MAESLKETLSAASEKACRPVFSAGDPWPTRAAKPLCPVFVAIAPQRTYT